MNLSTPGGSGSEVHSSSDSDLTRIKGSSRTSVDVLASDCSATLDVRSSQDGVSSDSHEMLIAPSIARDKGINIIPLGEKPPAIFDPTTSVGEGGGIGNTSFRVRPSFVSNDHAVVSSSTSNFGVPTSGILRRPCLASTPNLAIISGMAGDLAYNMTPTGPVVIGGPDGKPMGHATLGRTPSVSCDIFLTI